MAITGILGGFNEQRAAGANYLSTLDQMRRAQIAQQLEAQRQQAQQSQFGQELAQRQAQAQQTAELERTRQQANIAQQERDYGLRSQELGFRSQEQGLRGQEFGLKQQEAARTAQQRNALQGLLSQSDLGTAELGRAILPYDAPTGIGLIKSAREEEAARRREQQEADKAARDEWQIFEKEGVRVNKATGAVEKLNMPIGTGTAKTTGEEKKAAGLATRLENSLRTITSVTGGSPDAAGPEIWPSIVEKIPLIGEVSAQGLRSGPRQQIEAAQLDALDAGLTLTTGAAYTKEQLKNIGKSYFPQINDTEETKADKQQRFATLIESARIQAGGAEPMIEQALGRANVRTGTSAEPQNWQSTYKSQAQAVQDAMEAIRKGAPRDAVKARLQQIGITDARL